MGLRYTIYRVSHIIESKLGILKKRHPKNPILKKSISLKDWKDMDNTFIIEAREKIKFDKNRIPINLDYPAGINNKRVKQYYCELIMSSVNNQPYIPKFRINKYDRNSSVCPEHNIFP